MPEQKDLQKEFLELMLRKSFFFPAAEIYGESFSGFWDFGPIGRKIKEKMISAWRTELVEKEDFLEIDGAVILPSPVFKASGHLENFNDPLTQCKKCHAMYRADSLLTEHINVNFPEGMPSGKFDALIKEHKLRCPKCKGELDKVKRFNMMFELNVGATGNQKGYLRPETAQNIFLDFPRLFKSMRISLPVGIAQYGKAFRNEIAPRNSLLRVREFYQNEIEIFFNPAEINNFPKFDSIKNEKVNVLRQNSKKIESFSAKDLVEKKIVSGKLIAYYLVKLQKFFEKIGFEKEKMRFREVGADEKAFYSKETFDFEVETSFGWIELVANNYRTDYDLLQHSKESKKDLSIAIDGKKFVPHVFEISMGSTRSFFCLLNNALKIEEKKGEKRVLMDLPISVAPFIAGVFPLVNKDEIDKKAAELFEELRSHNFEVVFDSGGSIGRRYARIDEMGVPFAITFDYDSLKDNTVTIRERNSTQQKRIKISALPELLWKLSIDKTTFAKI